MPPVGCVGKTSEFEADLWLYFGIFGKSEKTKKLLEARIMGKDDEDDDILSSGSETESESEEDEDTGLTENQNRYGLLTLDYYLLIIFLT